MIIFSHTIHDNILCSSLSWTEGTWLWRVDCLKVSGGWYSACTLGASDWQSLKEMGGTWERRNVLTESSSWFLGWLHWATMDGLQWIGLLCDGKITNWNFFDFSLWCVAIRIYAMILVHPLCLPTPGHSHTLPFSSSLCLLHLFLLNKICYLERILEIILFNHISFTRIISIALFIYDLLIYTQVFLVANNSLQF